MANLTIHKKEFLQTCKKLKTIISHPENADREQSLGLFQESLASALGFRNLNAINTFFEKEKSLIQKEYNFFDYVQPGELSYLFNMLLSENIYSNMWITRAINLLNIIDNLLFELKKQNVILSINSTLIEKFCDLDEIIKIHKTYDFKLNNHLKKQIDSYLKSLTDYVQAAPKQSSTPYEQHNYLVMQLNPIINILAQLESEPILICPASIKTASKKAVEHYDYINPIVKWDKMLVSNFYSGDIQRLIMTHNESEQPHTLQDLILLYVRTLNRIDHRSAFKEIQVFLENINTVKSYSRELKVFLGS